MVDGGPLNGMGREEFKAGWLRLMDAQMVVIFVVYVDVVGGGGVADCSMRVEASRWS